MTFADIICHLVSEGILPGVSSVLSFIPSIAIMIFLLTLLRECGVITGHAAPFLMGFSCSVPAIIACKDIQNMRRRILTVLLIPYMSCSAKLPIYVMLASAFFPAYPLAAIGGVYLTGILIVLICSLTAKRLGIMQSAPFHEFKLKRPSLAIVFDAVKNSCLGFVRKAFTVILAASIIIWLLQNLDMSLRFTSHIDESLLAHFGRFISPAFAPLGFGDWKAATAVITGISSKESVVSTFAVIAKGSGKGDLAVSLFEIFTPASALSFMVFCLLYMPCIATLVAIKNVTGHLRYAMLALAGQTVIAWSIAFVVFNVGNVILSL